MNEIKISENGSNGSVEEGNTNPSSTRAIASKRWCFTWNNFDGSKYKDFLDELNKFGKYVVGQEKGKKGTPHLQGYIEFYTKQRPKECIKIKEIHWEKARGSKEQNYAYCTKDACFVSTLKIRKLVEDPFEINKLKYYDWQEEIIDIISEKPDDRKVYWYWSENGAVGKSVFTKHLCLKFGAVMVTGKGSDIKYILAEKLTKNEEDIDIVIFDIPRVNEGHISYSAFEEIKNGNICSGKYEGKNIIFNTPHIICFANFEPEYRYLSSDRWVVKKLD